MLSGNKTFRNLIVGTLIILFGFTAIFNIFTNQNSIKVGNFNIKIVDIASLGGTKESKDNRYYQNAVRTIILHTLLKKEAKNLGIEIADADLKDFLKKSFSVDGEFDPKKMNDFMSKNRISKDGLRIIAELEILKKQLSGIIDLGMPRQHEIAKSLVEKVNSKRSGYYMNIDPGKVDVQKYGAPKDDDLFEMLINDDQEIIDGQSCEVIKIGQDTGSYSIDELKSKFPIKEYPISKGIVIGECKMPIEEMEIDHNNYLSKPFVNLNGERVQVKFKEMFGLEKSFVEKNWYKSDAAKARACFSIIDFMKTLLKNGPDGINPKKLPSGVTFTKVKNVTFSDCFQKRCSKCPDNGKCQSCMSNDCICKKCFNPANQNGLSRPISIMMLFSPLKVLSSYKGEGGYCLVYPTEDSKGDFTENDSDMAAENIRLQLCASAQMLQLETILSMNQIKI